MQDFFATSSYLSLALYQDQLTPFLLAKSENARPPSIMQEYLDQQVPGEARAQNG